MTKETDSSSAPLEGLKVLVVDDEPDARTFIRTVLEDHGATVIEARDGDEGLQRARSERPELMTLDLGMPGKNGAEVFHEMRRDPDLSSILICIITGRPEMRKLIYERDKGLPPEGYLDKPLNERALINNIRRIVELGRRSKSRRAAPAA